MIHSRAGMCENMYQLVKPSKIDSRQPMIPKRNQVKDDTLKLELLNLSLGSMGATFYNYSFIIYFEHVFS